MKKWKIMILFLSLAAVFSGCGKETAAETEKTEETYDILKPLEKETTKEETQALMETTVSESQEETSAPDIVFRPDFLPEDIWGDWENPSEIMDSQGSLIPVTQTLSLESDGTAILTEVPLGESNVLCTYEGSYDVTDDRILTITLNHTDGHLLREAGEEKETFSASCRIQCGVGGTLILEEENDPGIRVTRLYRGGYASSNPLLTYDYINCDGEVFRLRHAILEYRRDRDELWIAPPGDGVMLRGVEEDSWLFEAYTTEGTIPMPPEWYRIDPDTLEGQALSDGTAIDFNKFTGPFDETEKILSGAIDYYNTFEAEDTPADFARIMESNGPLLMVNVYSTDRYSMGFVKQYIIDRNSGESYDAYAAEPEMFNIFD